MKSSILYLHSPTVRPKDIVRLSGDPLIQDSLNMFLDYGGDKEFIVKGYVDASFDTDPDDSKSQSGYILKVGAIS